MPTSACFTAASAAFKFARACFTEALAPATRLLAAASDAFDACAWACALSRFCWGTASRSTSVRVRVEIGSGEVGLGPGRLHIRADLGDLCLRDGEGRFGPGQVCFCRRVGRLRAAEGDPVAGRVDREEHVALCDDLVVAHAHAFDAARHLGRQPRDVPFNERIVRRLVVRGMDEIRRGADASAYQQKRPGNPDPGSLVQWLLAFAAIPRAFFGRRGVGARPVVGRSRLGVGVAHGRATWLRAAPGSSPAGATNCCNIACLEHSNCRARRPARGQLSYDAGWRRCARRQGRSGSAAA